MKSNHFRREQISIGGEAWISNYIPETRCPTFCFKCTLGKLQAPNKMVHSSSRTPWFASMIVWRRLTLAKVRIYWATMRCRDFLWWRVFLDPKPPLLSPFPLRWEKKAHHWRYRNWWYFVSGKTQPSGEKKQTIRLETKPSLQMFRKKQGIWSTSSYAVQEKNMYNVNHASLRFCFHG